MEESKFNFSDEPQQNEAQSTQENKEAVTKGAKGLFQTFSMFIKELLNFRKDTDRDTTIDAIKGDIPFKGATAWILVCSIFVASFGLNANSEAVVIGAMLISPLMGPILGIGMSIAINDIDTLRRSLVNFAVMVVLSVVTAFLFFYLFPLREESSQLLARTAPDIRDVFIAFFGGLALVIARTKKGTIASVIFGVAIATALMPPLCTVGFGLAIGNWAYAGGAMYLFTINTVFIALATFLVLKILRFPMLKYANSARRKRTARIASFIAVLTMIPAGITFYNVFQQSIFRKNVNEFLRNEVALFELPKGGRYLENLTEVNYDGPQGKTIDLVFMGDNMIPESVENTWRTKLPSYGLEETILNITQGGQDESGQMLEYVSELYESKKAEVATKDQRIEMLEKEVNRLSKLSAGQIPFSQISDEAKVLYGESIRSIAFSNVIRSDFNRIDTIPTFVLTWKDNLPSDTTKEREKKKIEEWLKLKVGAKKFLLEIEN
ncbi:DUF389 domain-containing protein [Sungkyunkwania multivorans]|uniref:DUF389 domain-containing protein n=1 Tax=Sungkyunkwania multivorans TaxID=1173618 RepID=A0ABW3D197_9FLAO